MKVSVIIPAAGSGQRFGEAKQFKELAGRPLFFHTIIPFLQSDKIQEIILVVPRDEVEHALALIEHYRNSITPEDSSIA